MNTKTKEGARNKGNPYFLRVPWHKGGLVNTGPDHENLIGVSDRMVAGATFVVLCGVARYARRKFLSSCLQLRF